MEEEEFQNLLALRDTLRRMDNLILEAALNGAWNKAAIHKLESTEANLRGQVGAIKSRNK